MKEFIFFCLIIITVLYIKISNFSIFNTNELMLNSIKNEKYCIVQFDNRKIIPAKLKKLIKLNKKHCNKYKIDHIFINNENNMSPYWKKVELVLRYINTNKYDYVLWLDTDALINTNYNVFILIKKFIGDNDIIISNDMPPWQSCEFNAGVWCVRNTKISKIILKEWLSYYDSKSWYKIKDEWYCGNNLRRSRCIWAGDKYEQGSFIKYILPKYRYNIKKVSYKILNNNNYTENKNCINHFAGFYKKNIDYIL